MCCSKMCLGTQGMYVQAVRVAVSATPAGADQQKMICPIQPDFAKAPKLVQQAVACSRKHLICLRHHSVDSVCCCCVTQAIDEKAKAVACGSSRSCATRYPVKEECGLIWVWPTAGPAAEAAAAAEPVPLSKGLVAAFNAGKASSWYRRELPYSWDVLVENLTDPCES